MATEGTIPASSELAGAAPELRRSLPVRIGRSPYFRGLLVPIAVFVMWQVIASTHAVRTAFLPSPEEVWRGWRVWAFGKESPLSWTSGTFFHFCYLSAKRVYIGFAIGAAFGLFFGILVGWFRLARDLFEPFIQALRPIPITAWLPFATLLFGIQESAAVFVIAMGCFFPVVVNTTAGAQQTPRLLVRAALMLGTRRHRLLLRVVLPNALPSIVTGLRLGLGIAWVLVIVAEMLAVQGGLGFAIWGAYEYLRMDLILASIIALGVLGWLSDQVLVLCARYLLRWQKGLVHS
jgi:NitT/TauT family transport system permease protein